jgi:hypothetical protein
MFPLEFPLRVLRRHASSRDIVLDPFCGRGTTNFASRLLGLASIAIDSSPIAVAATSAKLTRPVNPQQVVDEASRILAGRKHTSIPSGSFWKLAYQPRTLEAICKLRDALLDDCRSAPRKALRGILLGALHGPLRNSGGSSYFSNQSPRTYAPKPDYAVAYWRRNKLRPPNVDVREIIEVRASRYFSDLPPVTDHVVRRGDSRRLSEVAKACGKRRPKLIITSPPYYGLRTYVSDQWLRNWFLGGPDHVDYSYGVQLSHRSLASFVGDLRRVWKNAAEVSHQDARLVFRFGAINDRRVDPRTIIKSSLEDTPWRLTNLVNAGNAGHGKRQADSFGAKIRKPIIEFDAWAVRV